MLLVNCSVFLQCILIIFIWNPKDPLGAPQVTASWMSGVCEGLRMVSIRIMNSGISETNWLQRMALEWSHAYFWNLRAWGLSAEMKSFQTKSLEEPGSVVASTCEGMALPFSLIQSEIWRWGQRKDTQGQLNSQKVLIKKIW